MKKTPLFEDHVKAGGKMVEFAGWNMPIQYVGIKEEHQWVREHVGLFDVSHMGEIRVQGTQSLPTLQWLTSNDVSKLGAGEAQYSLLPNDQGGLVDDIIIYCLKPNQDYLVCVNASNTDKDWNWFNQHNKGAALKNESSFWAQIAIQGPKAPQLMQKVFGISTGKAFTMRAWEDCWIAFTGYTGEVGGEIFVPAARASEIWNRLLASGEAKPIGLGARDTLRTEMKYSLYGHEIDDTTNPYEAGLGWVVKPSVKDFLGKNQILAAKEKGLKRQLIGFRMKDKGIPRQGYKLLGPGGEVVGVCTSGTHSPSLNEPVGIGYLAKELAAAGTEFFVDIRGRKTAAVVAPTPFVKTSLAGS